MRNTVEKIVDAIVGKLAHDHTYVVDIIRNRMNEEERRQLALACRRIISIIQNMEYDAQDIK